MFFGPAGWKHNYEPAFLYDLFPMNDMRTLAMARRKIGQRKSNVNDKVSMRRPHPFTPYGSISTPGFSTPFGSTARLAARSAAAKGAGRCWSYHGRCCRPTA